MGNLLRKNSSELNVQTETKRLKRPREDDNEDSIQNMKRVKLSSGENYLYNTFFKESRNYDVIIKAFNRVWKLHKMFLCQSPYFQVMFEGSFAEAKTDAKEIHLKFDDSFITEESLDTVLASFYSCEINLTKQNIHRILATARFLQCDEIVQKCEKMLTRLVNRNNCLIVYYFASKYSLQLLEDFIFKWLLINLMVIKTNKILCQISIELWIRLIKSSQFVVETEFILYKVLRHYVQLKLIPIPNEKKVITIDPDYFKKREGEAFLLTDEGKQFADLFRALRLRNLLTSAKEVMEVIGDNLIPMEWIHPIVSENWLAMLSIESSTNIGPCKELVTKEEFEENAMRVSKIIPAPDIHRWRWTCFFYGLDINFCFDGKRCFVKRIHTIDNKRILTGHLTRRLMLRIQVLELISGITERNEEIVVKTLSLNEEKILFNLNKEIKYPSVLSLEILCVLPNCFERMKQLKSVNIPEPLTDENDIQELYHHNPNDEENQAVSVESDASDDGINFDADSDQDS